MTARTITPWDLIDALESGEYVPGFGQLRRVITADVERVEVHDDHGNVFVELRQRPVVEVQHCCIGVACELAGVKYEDKWGIVFPTEVGRVPEWLTVDLQCLLAQLNDSDPSGRYANVISFLKDRFGPRPEPVVLDVQNGVIR